MTKRGKNACCLAALIGTLVSPNAAMAVGAVETAKVVRISVQSDGSAYLATNISGGVPGAPACSGTTAYHFAFWANTPTGQALLSAALSAKLSQVDVRIYGTGACTVHGAIETMTFIDLKP